MNSQQEELGIKVQQWLKENISIIAIVVISLVYVLYGLITIEESGKSIGQIIADGAISFMMGFLIKSLLNSQGLTNGEKSEIFIETRKQYTTLIDDISDIQHYLGNFCDYQNEETLRKAQTSILRSELLKYDDFINNKIEYEKLNKHQKKAFDKARKIKINNISESILLSDCRNFIETGKDININKQSYLKKSNSATLIVMLATAVIFGYFSVDRNEGFNVAGAIWSLIQVAYYLGIGAFQYFQGYTFMTDTYKTALLRKKSYIEKFKNMYNENPDRFKSAEQLEFERLKREQELEIEKQKNEQELEIKRLIELGKLKEKELEEFAKQEQETEETTYEEELETKKEEEQ